MRKLSFLIVVVAIFFISSILVIPVFAQTAQHKKPVVATETVSGSVVSVDKARKEIIVKDEKTGQDRTFVVSQKAVSVVKTGEKVKVKVKPGSNLAESVKVLNPEPKKK